MPHKCTKCNTVFKEGTADLLKGCPKCGWNKFLYIDTSVKKEEPQTKETPEKVPKAPEKTQEIGKKVETIRIVETGSYEVNLSSLFERDEIVMAIKGEGKYILHIPSVFNKKKSQR